MLTGAMLTPEELKGLCELCDRTGVQFISDELYHGITFTGAPRAATALEFSPNAIVINGFSKSYSMTGWRLGWLLAPPHLDACADALNQNMNVSAPTVSQRAAVAALSSESAVELRAHVKKYEANRQVVVDALHAMGIVPTEYAPPSGAFCTRTAAARLLLLLLPKNASPAALAFCWLMARSSLPPMRSVELTRLWLLWLVPVPPPLRMQTCT